MAEHAVTATAREALELVSKSKSAEPMNVKTITKTPLATRYIDRLNDINDQLCFGALSSAEFEVLLTPMLTKMPNAFAPAVFPKNPHVGRVYRTVRELADFQAKSINVVCSSSLIAGAEHMRSYLVDIFNYVSLLTGTAVQKTKDDSEDDHVRKLAKRLKITTLDEILDTAEYIRRRRNHVAHLKSEPTQEMKAFLRVGSKKLDEHWANRPTEMFGFTFTNTELSNFTFDETYALMNIMRVCMKVIDEVFAPILPADEVAKEAYQNVRHINPKSGRDVLIRKTRAFIAMHYGATLEKEYIANLVS